LDRKIFAVKTGYGALLQNGAYGLGRRICYKEAIMAFTETDAIRLVETYWKQANLPKPPTVAKTLRIVDGQLFFVSIIDANGKETMEYVYSVGSNATRHLTLEAAIDAISHRPTWTNVLYTTLDVGGIDGIIAMDFGKNLADS
jgi:hypothetical protein